jgi:hypothetical protein
MRALLFVAAIAAVCKAVLASGDFVELEPVPRYLWDPNVAHQKRDGSSQEAIVTLGDHEQLLWSTGNRETSSPYPTRSLFHLMEIEERPRRRGSRRENGG